MCLCPSGYADERSSLGERGKNATGRRFWRSEVLDARRRRRGLIRDFGKQPTGRFSVSRVAQSTASRPQRAATMRQDGRGAITRRSWKNRSLFRRVLASRLVSRQAHASVPKAKYKATLDIPNNELIIALFRIHAIIESHR